MADLTEKFVERSNSNTPKKIEASSIENVLLNKKEKYKYVNNTKII